MQQRHSRPYRTAALSGLATASLALLSATMPLNSVAIGADGLGEAQLLPFGEFSARDGRPGPGMAWKVSNETGRAMAAALNAIVRQTPLVIDYEHQTLTAMELGHKAPAAGWVGQVEWRDGQGLFSKVKWTAAARGHINAEEYRFISPVISFDEAGNVTGVLMGALVNYPALLGMEPVVAALSAFSRFSPHTPEPQMDRAALLALLGLAADATDAQINTAVAKLSGELPKLRLAGERPLLTAPLATALGVPVNADETAALSAVSALRTAQVGSDTAAGRAIAALQGEVAALRGQMVQGELNAVVDGAITEGRFLPAVRDFLLDMGRKDLTALKAYIGATPVVAGLQGQSGGQDRGKGTEALSGLTAEVMRNFGLTPEQFAAGAAKTA